MTFCKNFSLYGIKAITVTTVNSKPKIKENGESKQNNP
jgi:hypothetical protein